MVLVTQNPRACICLSNNYFVSFFREEEAIKLDGLNVAQMKELREKSEKFVFQAEVDRMMKLIINSLYKNKEVSIMPFMYIIHYKFIRNLVQCLLSGTVYLGLIPS